MTMCSFIPPQGLPDLENNGLDMTACLSIALTEMIAA